MQTSAQPDLTLIYQGLFCDHHALHPPDEGTIPAISVLPSDTTDESLKSISSDHSAEARRRLRAYRLLEQRGHTVAETELLGVVVEVGLDEGLDVLAIYRDGTARYINYSGKLIIWEASTPEVDALISETFLKSEQIVSRIGPWTEPRKPPPPTGTLRISFLVSDGLYFGEGPINALFADQLAGPVLGLMTQIMQELVNRTP